MAKGITIMESPSFEKIMDKIYYVDGIEEVISLDDSGTPIFKLQNNELKIWVKFRCMENNGQREEGPAISLSPPEFIGLVQALGGTDFAPTKQNRTQMAVILEGIEKANTNEGSLAVESKEGWTSVYNISTLHPSEGKYTVRFKSAFSPKHREEHDKYDFSDGANDSKYLILKFEVVGDGEGNPSMWDGFEISIFMNNAFVDYCEDNGVVYNAIEEGRPVGAAGKNRDRWYEFGKYFIPGIWEEYDWQIDPIKSQWGVCEVKKPQYVMFNQALERNVKVAVWYEKKEKKEDFWFDMLTLRQHNSTPEIKATVTPQDFVDFVKARTWGDNMEVAQIFETESPIVFKMDDDGNSQWAQTYLGGETGPWIGAGLSLENRSFDVLSEEQLTNLLDEMKARYP